MNIDEAIKILNDNIENCNAWLEDNDTEDIIWWKNQKQAIETIINEYNNLKQIEEAHRIENGELMKRIKQLEEIDSHIQKND